jgi:hypothetical protein
MPDQPASDPSPVASIQTEGIICRVTLWYYKRRAMMAAMFLGFGAYFLYDGSVGYPKEVAIAKKKEWFTDVFAASHDEAKKAGRLEAWIAEAKAQGLPTGTDGEPPKWVTYAAANGWPEEPHHFTEKEIAEQFYFGYGCLAAAVAIGILVLLRKNTVIRGEADHFITPDGERVNYADVFRVDTRKWDNKGLAYAWHRKEGQGRERKATLDDLMYDGTAKVLERLLSRFNGELIEKITEPETAPAEPAPEAADTREKAPTEQ